MVMLFAQMREQYVQGVHDAAEIAQTIADQRPLSRELANAAPSSLEDKPEAA
jgi:hypothetical protein